MNITRWSNKPDAANPAIASQFHVERHWCRVADPGRSVLSIFRLRRERRLVFRVRAVARTFPLESRDSTRLSTPPQL